MSFITRFAPSPTGDLHIGSVRTALYCWLMAQKQQGKLILRIEDTDLERSTKESVNIILNGLSWLGLNWDLGPFFQSERFEAYLNVATNLINQGLAYRCDCSKERLEQLRTHQLQMQQKPKYDHHCREKNLSNSHNTPFVIRFKNPLHGVVEFDDLVRGKIITSNNELDDLIIVRSDNTPTYNLTVVVDDIEMGVTDVIRGEDHISNTPKQINLFSALGAKVPRYAHIPMILGSDGNRLSKRHGATNVLSYKKLGILPQALINYLAKLGWSHKNQEIFSIEELIQLFDLNKVQKSPAIFNMDKLLWLNQHYINISTQSDLLLLLKEHLLAIGFEATPSLEPKLIKIIELYKNRVKTLAEMATESKILLRPELSIDFNLFLAEFEQIKINPNIIAALQQLHQDLIAINLWEAENIHMSLKNTLAQFNLNFKDLAVPLRIAIIGQKQSPPLDKILEICGKQTTLNRLTNFLQQLLLTSTIK